MRRRLAFLPARYRFPFEFGGQALARPAGEGIGFEIGDMRDRGAGIAVMPAGMGELLALVPVERRAHAVFAHPGPAIGEPQAGGVIAAIGDEFGPVAIGHQPLRQREGFEQDAVRGAFIVEGEAIRLVADPGDAAGVFVPVLRLRLCGWHGRIPHRHAERVLEQRVLDIGEQQFLVLLFVGEPEFDQRRELLACEQRLHRGIDMRAPMADVRQRRARQHPARKAMDALAFCLVIGIEYEGPALVEQCISAEMVAQQEGFPEPRRMRQVPFGGAGIFHRLDRRIGFRQRSGKRLAQRAGRGVATLDFLSQRGLRLRLDLVQCRSP